MYFCSFTDNDYGGFQFTLCLKFARREPGGAAMPEQIFVLKRGPCQKELSSPYNLQPAEVVQKDFTQGWPSWRSSFQLMQFTP